MTVRAYIRVSTADQAEGGYSLPAQRSKCEAWASYQGQKNLVIYEDAGLSGKRDDRPAFTALLLDLQAGDIVLTYSLSRLGRGGVVQLLNVVSRIKEAGARLVSMTESIDTETHTGRLMLTILAALAEMEVEQTRERTEMGRIQAAAQGLYPHNPSSLPTGYTTDDDNRIIPDPIHADTIRFIFSQGGATYAEIARRLIAANIPTPRGGTWTFVQVARIVNDPTYHQGYVAYRSKAHPGQPERHVHIPAEALVTPEEWQAAQRTRATNNPHKQPDLFPLSGHLRCQCGSPLGGRNPKKKGWTTRYVCYPRRRHTPTCPSNGGVTRVYANAEQIGRTARQALAQYLTDPDDPARTASLYATQAPADPHAEARAELERKLTALVDLYLEQLIDKPTYEARRATLTAQLITLTPTPTDPTPNRSTAPELAQMILDSTNEEFSALLKQMNADLILGENRTVRVLHAEFPADS